MKNSESSVNPLVLEKDVTKRFGSSRIVDRGVHVVDTSFFIFPEYENVQDDNSDVHTVAHAVLHAPNDCLVTPILAVEFSVNRMLQSGVVPQVVNPASFYRIDKTEAIQSVNSVVSNIKESDIVVESVEPQNS